VLDFFVGHAARTASKAIALDVRATSRDQLK
jgi:hypothetical protein